MQLQTGKKENVIYNISDKSNEIPNNDWNLVDKGKNYQTHEVKNIEGTPFKMVRQTPDNDKIKYFIVMGDNRLTEPTDTEEETLQKLVTDYWKIVVNVIAIVTEIMIQDKTKRQEQAIL